MTDVAITSTKIVGVNVLVTSNNTRHPRVIRFKRGNDVKENVCNVALPFWTPNNNVRKRRDEIPDIYSAPLFEKSIASEEKTVFMIPIVT